MKRLIINFLRSLKSMNPYASLRKRPNVTPSVVRQFFQLFVSVKRVSDIEEGT